jgi:hypothetical protein
MNEAQFWEFIETAKNKSNDFEERAENLKKELSNLSNNDIKIFDDIYFDQIIRAYCWELWGAAYVINGGCPDDGFRCFCDFLISEGKEIFESALNHPDSLAELHDIEDAELEEFGYIAMELYEEKTGSELPIRSKGYPKEQIGDEWNEDGVEKLYPKLAEKYW